MLEYDFYFIFLWSLFLYNCFYCGASCVSFLCLYWIQQMFLSSDPALSWERAFSLFWPSCFRVPAEDGVPFARQQQQPPSATQTTATASATSAAPATAPIFLLHQRQGQPATGTAWLPARSSGCPTLGPTHVLASVWGREDPPDPAVQCLPGHHHDPPGEGALRGSRAAAGSLRRACHHSLHGEHLWDVGEEHEAAHRLRAAAVWLSSAEGGWQDCCAAGQSCLNEYVCACMCVCLYAFFLYERLKRNKCGCVCICECVCVCMLKWMLVCMFVCMHVCGLVCVCVCGLTKGRLLSCGEIRMRAGWTVSITFNVIIVTKPHINLEKQTSIHKDPTGPVYAVSIFPHCAGLRDAKCHPALDCAVRGGAQCLANPLWGVQRQNSFRHLRPRGHHAGDGWLLPLH